MYTYKTDESREKIITMSTWGGVSIHNASHAAHCVSLPAIEALPQNQWHTFLKGSFIYDLDLKLFAWLKINKLTLILNL